MSKRTEQISFFTDSKRHSAGTIAKILKIKDKSHLELLSYELEEQLERIKSGNCEDIEELLLAQANTLNCLFTQLTIKGMGALDEPVMIQRMPHIPKSLLNLALKAQNQSRRTLQTISEIKNPKRTTTFVKNYVDKQLNQLSVNERESEPKILGEASNAKVDFSSQTKAVENDPQKQAVETQYGTENKRRKRN